MEIRRVEIVGPDAVSDYECRFCREPVLYRTRECPKCGIPRPAKEAMGQRFIYELLAVVAAFGAVGFLAGHLTDSWTWRVVGTLVGAIFGFVVSRSRAGRTEVRLRTHAFVRLNPEAIDWPATEVASRVGTPAASVVARALKDARLSR